MCRASTDPRGGYRCFSARLSDAKRNLAKAEADGNEARQEKYAALVAELEPQAEAEKAEKAVERAISKAASAITLDSDIPLPELIVDGATAQTVRYVNLHEDGRVSVSDTFDSAASERWEVSPSTSRTALESGLSDLREDFARVMAVSDGDASNRIEDHLREIGGDWGDSPLEYSDGEDIQETALAQTNEVIETEVMRMLPDGAEMSLETSDLQRTTVNVTMPDGGEISVDVDVDPAYVPAGGADISGVLYAIEDYEPRVPAPGIDALPHYGVAEGQPAH